MNEQTIISPGPLVKITDFTKIDSTLNPHVEFKIEFGNYVHYKRYSEFEKLDGYLRRQYDYLVPFLPPKKYLGRFDAIFLRIRQILLEWYLNELLEHPVLKNDSVLNQFLISVIMNVPTVKSLSSNSLLNLFKSAPKFFEQDDDLRVMPGKTKAIKGNYEDLTSHMQMAVESLNDSIQVLGKLKSNMQLFGNSNLHTHPKLSKRSACVGSIFNSLVEINKSRMNADQRLLAVLQMSQGQMDAIDDLLTHRKRDQEALATALQPKSGKTTNDIEECKVQLENTGIQIKKDVANSERARANLIKKTISKILLEMTECQRQSVIQWESYATEIKRKTSLTSGQFQQEAFVLGSESEDESKKKKPIFTNDFSTPATPLTPEQDLTGFSLLQPIESIKDIVANSEKKQIISEPFSEDSSPSKISATNPWD